MQGPDFAELLDVARLGHLRQRATGGVQAKDQCNSKPAGGTWTSERKPVVNRSGRTRCEVVEACPAIAVVGIAVGAVRADAVHPVGIAATHSAEQRTKQRRVAQSCRSNGMGRARTVPARFVS